MLQDLEHLALLQELGTIILCHFVCLGWRRWGRGWGRGWGRSGVEARSADAWWKGQLLDCLVLYLWSGGVGLIK